LKIRQKNNKEFDKNIEAIMKQAEKADAWIVEQVDSFAKNAIRNEGKDHKGKEGAGSRAKDTKDIRDEYDSKYGIKAVFEKSNEALEKRIGADKAWNHSKEMASEKYGKFKKRNQDGLERSKNVMANVALPLLKTQDEYTRLMNLAERVNNLALFQLEKHYKANFGNDYKKYKDTKELMVYGSLITINHATKSNDKIAEAENLKTQLRDLMDKKPHLVPEELKIPILYETGGLKMAAKAMSWVADLVTLQKPVRGIKGLLEENATKPLTQANVDAHNKASKTLKESNDVTPPLALSRSGSVISDELESIKSKGVVSGAKKAILSKESSSSRSNRSSRSDSFGR